MKVDEDKMIVYLTTDDCGGRWDEVKWWNLMPYIKELQRKTAEIKAAGYRVIFSNSKGEE